MHTKECRRTLAFFGLLLMIALLAGLLATQAVAAGSGEVTVSTAHDFIQAVNSDSVWKITLESDIIIEYGMTDALGRWNVNYKSTDKPGYSGLPQGILVGDKSGAGGGGRFVIDGGGQYKIAFNWPHTIVAQGNFYFPYSSQVKAFTMKDVTWHGSSEIGCYFPLENITSNLTITFDNVTYKGPGMGDIAMLAMYNAQVLFRNCDITMTYRNSYGGDADGYGGSLPSAGTAPNGADWQDTHASETIAANFVTFEGINTITKYDSPANGGGLYGDIDPIFYIYSAGDSYIKIAPGASLIINDEAGKTKQSSYSTGLIGTHTSLYNTPIIVGQNATFEYHHVGGGNGFITDYYMLGSLTIGDNASVVFDIKADTKFNANDASAYPAYFTADTISIGQNARWTYIADYAGSAADADNAMVSTNSITIGEGAEVNLIARNNTKAKTVIALQGSNPKISITNPQSVVLFNSKSSDGSYVISSESNASLSIQANGIRAWQMIPEGIVSISGTINPGNQGALMNNYVIEPDTEYQWVLDDETYSATVRPTGALSGTSHGGILSFSGAQTLKNINLLELRAKTTEPTDPEPTDPEPTDPEPTDPEPTDPEPTDPEPTDPEPTDPEPTDPEPTDPEPTDPEPTDPEPTDPEPTDPKPTDPEPTDPEPTDPEPTDPEPTDPEPTDPEPTDPEPTDPEPTDPEPTDPEPTDPEPTDPEPTDPEPTDPEPTDPEPTNPKPTDPEPTDPEPTDPEPTDPEPTDPEPTDPEPTDPEPTDPEPTDPEPTDPEPTDPEPTDPEPTDPEPTDPEPTTPIPPSPTPTNPIPTIPVYPDDTDDEMDGDEEDAELDESDIPLGDLELEDDAESEDDEIEIVDEDVPLDNVPKTGESPMSRIAYTLLALASMLLPLCLSKRKVM